MNSETLYQYYKAYIEEANDNILNELKNDITLAEKNKLLNRQHHAKLIRLIIKRKRINKLLEVA